MKFISYIGPKKHYWGLPIIIPDKIQKGMGVGMGKCNDPPLISNYILKCCAELTMTNVHDHACIAGMNDESRNHLILIVFTHHYYEVKSPGVWWSPSLQQPGRRALGNPLRWPPRK